MLNHRIGSYPMVFFVSCTIGQLCSKLYNMRHWLFCLLLPLFSVFSQAQEDGSKERNRLNFAKTYFELGGSLIPGFKGIFTYGASNSAIKYEPSLVPYLNIGGIHYWGHADFYISIPLVQKNWPFRGVSDLQHGHSVVTGARFFPWATKPGIFRPYVGASWAVEYLKAASSTPLHTKNTLLLDIGGLYQRKNFAARIGVSMHPKHQWNYPVSNSNFQLLNTPTMRSYLGVIYTFESTSSNNMQRENQKMNAYSAFSSPTANAIKTMDWFIGVGPSSSFQLQSPTYNEVNYPYFTRKPISKTYLDIALGAHWNRLGLVNALSYRSPVFINEAFGTRQTIRRQSWAMECYKYVMDFHGFTPYFGLNMTYNRIQYSESANGTAWNKKITQWVPGLTFGWDILPGKTQQWFVLRTNLRWYPTTKFNLKGRAFQMHELEYNVIQAVFYPSRYRNARNKVNSKPW
jgi:hypothetical protein